MDIVLFNEISQILYYFELYKQKTKSNYFKKPDETAYLTMADFKSTPSTGAEQKSA